MQAEIGYNITSLLGAGQRSSLGSKEEPIMNNDNIIRGIALTLVVCAFALVLSTCGGVRKGTVVQGFSPGSSAEDKTSPEGLDYRETISLDEALAEINAYPCPDSVDAALFAELKDALGEALHEQWGASTSRSGVSCEFVGSPGLETDSPRGMGKFTSTPPTGDANKVTDLAATDNGDGTYTLTWHYINSGDYDQSGTVGISDITPIAMHYSETYELEDVNCLLAVIDGSGNYVVDIADITPIAMYYSTDCAGYRIQRGVSPDEFTSFGEIVLADATGDGRLSFSTEPLSVTQPYLRVTPYDAQGYPGEPSDPVFVSIPGDPPEITSVSPNSGMEGESVEFSAIVNGTPPFEYTWDFKDAVVGADTHSSSPSGTWGSPGTYNGCSLTVSNDYDEDTYPFTLTVTEETTYSVSGHVEKDTGGGLQGVTLTLTPGSYSATTNSGGDYTITDVPNGSYTLTPSLVDWTFDPLTHSVTVSDGSVTDKDFTATTGGGEDCVVSGHVEKNTGGGLQNVTLTLTPGEYSDITDAFGNYEITEVPEGWYTLTPNLAGWSFAPPTHDIEATPTSATPYFFIATADA